MSSFLEICEKAARAGGKVLQDWRPRFTAREKSPRDLVTEADVASQEEIRRILLNSFPDHAFVGEEDAASQSANIPADQPRWIVDPLDGTANYVHGMTGYSVSIALVHNGRLQVGTVYDPILDECYSAARGQGAWLNGKRLKPSACRTLDRAMIAASFSANVPRGSLEVTRFVEVLHVCQSVRRLGSCALNLCYVAAGRLDAYWTTAVKSWDAAAGILMVEEAGGTVTNVEGGPFVLERPEFAVSATPELNRSLVEVLSHARRIHAG